MEQKHLLPIGTILNNTYRIDRYLASGGFGNTYLVTHIEFEEQFAVKEFFMNGINDREETTNMVSVSNAVNRQQYEGQLEKFKKEARRLRQLKGLHTVRVHALFIENGTAYYVMDFIDGKSLKDIMAERRGAFSENEVRTLLPQLLDALEEIHAEGLQHLDLKPANIMVDKDGTAKLIDFGASKQMLPDGGATASSALCFTPGYAPSEQVDQNMNKFGPWTDLYALGATLFNLLSGEKPPLSSDIEDDPKEAFAPLSHVSREMQSFVAWLMQPNRRKRPQTVAEAKDKMPAGKVKEKERSHVVVDDDTVISIDDGEAVKKPKIRPMLKKPQPRTLLVIGLVVAGIVGCAALFYVVTAVKSNEKPQIQKDYEACLVDISLTSAVDSLSYAYGMAQSEGLEDYVDSVHHVNFAYKEEFCEGLLHRAELTSADCKPGLIPEALNAYNKGVSIGGEILNYLDQYNTSLFGEHSSEELSRKKVFAGLIQGLCYSFDVFTQQEARERIPDLIDKVRSGGSAGAYADIKAAGEAFIRKKSQLGDVFPVPECEGVYYKVLESAQPPSENLCEDGVCDLWYRMKTIDGEVLDEGTLKGIKLGTVVEGLQKALVRLPIGTLIEVYVPYQYAYGTKGTGSIKPCQALVFEAELLMGEVC
ncbi:MAG: protein kinase [Prevotella sp.]|nr:protein kinase [Prevotella sp.]